MPPPAPASTTDAGISQPLAALAQHVRTGDAAGQFEAIERIGLSELFTLQTMLAALGAGGVALLAFIAELGLEHSSEPGRCERVLQLCRATRNLPARAACVAVGTDLLALFGRPFVAQNGASPPRRLVILDDIFPVQLSAFRIAEYNAYLERYPDASVYSTGSAFHFARETRPMGAVIRDYESAYPALAGRVHAFDPRAIPPARLFYTIFVNNAHRFLPLAEATGTPLAFTLYPGGGFQLDDAKSDAKLRRIFASPSFNRVIVTQAVTHGYLLKKKFCAPEKIRSIFGGVLPANQLEAAGAPKRRYGFDKAALDICFVANKYMPGGVDKGFDTFLAVARRLVGQFPAAHFHVVGTLGAADGDFRGLDGRITVHGVLTTPALHRFFRDMDLILSPNLPFLLKPGAFDGFPTGCCVEAGLGGVAVFTTDELNERAPFKVGEEIVILTRDVEETAATVANYCREPERLHRLAAAGAKAFQRLYALANQMNPRFAVIDEILAEQPANAVAVPA